MRLHRQSKLGLSVLATAASGVAFLYYLLQRNKSINPQMKKEEESAVDVFKATSDVQVEVISLEERMPDLVSIKLSKGSHIKLELCSYGASITKLLVPDRHGKISDIVLGLNSPEDYISTGNPAFFGGIIGRCCNRIANGKFSIDNQSYQLTVNKPPNSLHGGKMGFGNVIWKYHVTKDHSLEFSYTSADGEEGYPGKLTVKVVYKIVQGEFEGKTRYGVSIEYEAIADDSATIVNMTNHSYFNLKGHNVGTCLDHQVQLFADHYTPVDENMIPTGELRSVNLTPFDFTKPKIIEQDLNKLYESTRGFDHNFVLRKSDQKKDNNLELAARVFAGDSGRVMEVFTTQPGIQFYTGNWVGVRLEGINGIQTKEKAVYTDYSGVCFETQKFPDSVNKKNFPSVVLRPGEKYYQKTVFLFSSSV